MAQHWNDEKKQDDAAVAVAPAEVRRKTAAKKKKANPSSSKPSASMDVPCVAAKARTKKSPPRNAVNNNGTPKGSLLDAVSAIMGPGTSTTASIISDITTDNISTASKPKKKKPINIAKRPSRQVDESDGAEQPVQPRSSIKSENKKAARPRPTKNIPPPPPPPTWIPTTTAMASSFFPTVETASQDRKLNDGTNNDAPQTTTKKKKKKKKPKLSAERQRNLQKELAKRRRAKTKDLSSPDENEPLQDVEWFNMSIKENNNIAIGLNHENEKDTTKKSKKKTKVIRTTVEYSRQYNFWTKKEVLQEEAQPGYYAEMIVVKRRTFHIRNLVSATAAKPQSSSIYQFHEQIVTLQAILDRKEDKWFIKSRLNQYVQQHERAMDDEEEDEEEEQGMEALSIFFGPNEIDDHHDNKNAEDNDDDDSGIFSIDSVESVHFSDDDETDQQLVYNGTKREMVEVMPGEFTILRKEEETHAAMKDGTYIESLCLGCGKALLSVQDALQVACPNCGSITPLNGICLHKPFGIATGIAAAKVKDQLAPRKNVFALSTERAQQEQQHPSSQSTPTGTRRVSTVADMKWTTGPATSPEQTQPPAERPPTSSSNPSRQQRTTQQRPRPASTASPQQQQQQQQQPIPPAIQSRRPRQPAKTTKPKSRPRKLLAGHG